MSNVSSVSGEDIHTSTNKIMFHINKTTKICSVRDYVFMYFLKNPSLFKFIFSDEPENHEHLGQLSFSVLSSHEYLFHDHLK